jgi:hypothetical protein
MDAFYGAVPGGSGTIFFYRFIFYRFRMAPPAKRQSLHQLRYGYSSVARMGMRPGHAAASWHDFTY